MTAWNTAPPMPEQIGKWKLIKRLGSGGFADVYSACNTNPQPDEPTEAALKLFRGIGSADEALIQAEAQKQQKVNHPQVIRCYGWFPISDGPMRGGHALLLELGDTSLQGVLERSGAMLPDDVRRMVLDVSQALSHCHARQIVHRDLKPGNIIRVGRTWKITDFGVSVALSGTHGYNQGRTIQYEPPEHAHAELGGQSGMRVRPPSDIWALGITTYQAIIGPDTHPYPGQTPQLRAANVGAHPAKRHISKQMPRDLHRLIDKRLLAVDPKRRITAEALVEDLGHQIPPQVTTAKETERTIERIRRSRRKRLSPLWAPTLAIVAFLGLVVVTPLLQDNPFDPEVVTVPDGGGERQADAPPATTAESVSPTTTAPPIGMILPLELSIPAWCVCAGPRGQAQVVVNVAVTNHAAGPLPLDPADPTAGFRLLVDDIHGGWQPGYDIGTQVSNVVLPVTGRLTRAIPPNPNRFYEELSDGSLTFATTFRTEPLATAETYNDTAACGDGGLRKSGDLVFYVPVGADSGAKIYGLAYVDASGLLIGYVPIKEFPATHDYPLAC